MRVVGGPVDTFECRRAVPGLRDTFVMSLPHAEASGAGPLSHLPYCLRVLAEHLLRREDGIQVRADDITALGAWVAEGTSMHSVAFFPARILMQDAAGLPALADLAALDEAVAQYGGNRSLVAPRLPIDLVVDHAVEVDAWASPDAREVNVEWEYSRHGVRYGFLKWVASRFPQLRVAPPDSGICHQLNLEVIAEPVRVYRTTDGDLLGFDSVLGTDSHTTMINGLSVFGWGVGGIEATSALLGEPTVLRIPDVIGVRLNGALRPGVQAADLALALTARLREEDLVQRIVEFCGEGLASLTVPDRATLANMAPEYGATMGYFPADRETIDYLRRTGRAEEEVRRTELFLRAQGMLRDADSAEPRYTAVIDFNLSAVANVVAGPSRPHQLRTLEEASRIVRSESTTASTVLADGAVVIAAITSCTNTSNPRALITAGLLARKAVAHGLRPPAWTKTSLAPGSRVAGDLLVDTGLQVDLDRMGFQVVGHGCTTCMGNSGPLDPTVERTITLGKLAVAAVLSGNRNFEGRIHPLVTHSLLASPALVVAYALAGSIRTDLSTKPIGRSSSGADVFLHDLWPTDAEVEEQLLRANQRKRFATNRENWMVGDAQWTALTVPTSDAFAWEGRDGFIRRPPFLESANIAALLGEDILGARALLLLGDGVTTDHISPVSRILPTSAAGRWLDDVGVPPSRHGSFSSRRLNHDVMIRGGFANSRIRNLLVPGVEGGITSLMPDAEARPIHEAAAIYAQRGVPLIVVAGANYGAGSARDWAAKVTRLLGVRAVVARSFERIHRSNLVAFGILPLEWMEDDAVDIRGDETFDLLGLPAGLRQGGSVTLRVHAPDSIVYERELRCRIETDVETEWLIAGGLFAKVVRDVVTPREDRARDTAGGVANDP